MLHALQVYSYTKFDFVDCLLTGYAKKEGSAIFTLDKKLQNQAWQQKISSDCLTTILISRASGYDVGNEFQPLTKPDGVSMRAIKVA